MKSSRIITFIAILWFFLGFSYYPKWEKPWSEATISWDVCGYYHYLPAIFIYKDIRQQNWMNEINQKYLPSPAYDQPFGHQNSGNKVNKYAIGQAVLFSPFFLMAHGYTTMTGAYPADGYSKPYQFFIWFGSLAFSILGLVLLRRILLYYFEDNIVTLTLVALAAGTHWMEYASITKRQLLSTPSPLSQKALNILSNFFGLNNWRIAFHHLPFLINEKFGEIPFDTLTT